MEFSTLVFLSLDPASVISISPAPDLHERTREEAIKREIDLAPARFVNDRSETALPLLALVESLEIDAGFIDGNHGWPAVFVDLWYLNRSCVQAGDDIQIYAIAQMVCFLRQLQPHHQFVGIDSKMATFRRFSTSRTYLTGGSSRSSRRTRRQPEHLQPFEGFLGSEDTAADTKLGLSVGTELTWSRSRGPAEADPRLRFTSVGC